MEPRESPCPAVGTYPIPATVNDNNASQHVSTQEQNISSSQPLDSIQSKLFLRLSGNLPPMIKWIPRSARQHCASLFTKLILAVVSKPNSEENWARLLLFGRMVLERPVRRNDHKNHVPLFLAVVLIIRMTFGIQLITIHK